MVCEARKVTLSSVLFLKHKVLGSVSREKTGGIDKADKPGHEGPHILCMEVWTSSLIIFVFINTKSDFYLWS